MSDSDSFPGITEMAADALAGQGHPVLASRVRSAAVFLTGQHDEDGDTVVIVWDAAAGSGPFSEPLPEGQLEVVRAALSASALDAAGWRFGRLHQRAVPAVSAGRG